MNTNILELIKEIHAKYPELTFMQIISNAVFQVDLVQGNMITPPYAYMSNEYIEKGLQLYSDYLDMCERLRP